MKTLARLAVALLVATDIMAHTLAQRLSDRFRQPFAIENKPGGLRQGPSRQAQLRLDRHRHLVASVRRHARFARGLRGVAHPVQGRRGGEGSPRGPHPVHVRDDPLFAPKGTPASVVAELNRATNEVVAERPIQKKMIEEGADPEAGTPEPFGAFVRREHDKWRKVVLESGASVN